MILDGRIDLPEIVRLSDEDNEARFVVGEIELSDLCTLTKR